LSEKTKMIVAGVLFSVAVVWLGLAFVPSAPKGSETPAAVKTPSQSAIDALNKPDADGKITVNMPKRGKGLTGPVDPTLRLDLLAKLQEVKYTGTERNIFQFYTPPPPPPPAPEKPIFTVKLPEPPPPPPTPPPPPPIPLKFFGLASAPGVSPRKAFLQDKEGDDVFIAKEGELVKKRYKVIKINDTNIEMEDTQNSSKQKIPLQET
jgi:hypothetical protein